MEEKRKIKIGVFGLGRGSVFTGFGSYPINFEVVALCDKNEERMLKVKEKGNLQSASTYTDFDEFIKHPGMEAVFLHNYFHQHAPFAIKAMRAGKHVFSDCTAAGTLAEAVELCEAVEETGMIYMFGENHGFQKTGLEIKRLYDAGEIGEVMYAEGEYNHPTTGVDKTKGRPSSDGPFHWRMWHPTTYYCTHAMGPLMYFTGLKPVEVNARSLLLRGPDRIPHVNGLRKSIKDSGGSVMMVTMSNGAIFRLFGTGIPGHCNSFRLHGSRGAMEMVHGPGYFGPGQLRIWHEPLHATPGVPLDRTYWPEWPAFASQANKYINHHQGGDFWCAYFFAEAIRSGAPVPYDVYDGCAMSAVGICGWKSALQGGVPVEIPDFRDKASRDKVRNDRTSPFLDENGNVPEGNVWIKNTLRDVTLESQIADVKEAYEFNVGHYFGTK